MSFVHGHARDTGWVVAHRRRPNEAEEGQLPLLAVGPAAEVDEPERVAVPRPRDSPESAQPSLF